MSHDNSFSICIWRGVSLPFQTKSHLADYGKRAFRIYIFSLFLAKYTYTHGIFRRRLRAHNPHSAERYWRGPSTRTPFRRNFTVTSTWSRGVGSFWLVVRCTCMTGKEGADRLASISPVTRNTDKRRNHNKRRTRPQFMIKGEGREHKLSLVRLTHPTRLDIFFHLVMVSRK